LYDEQFKKLINIKPKIYSMANDCYRCTWIVFNKKVV
jgi:hypothetical protein